MKQIKKLETLIDAHAEACRKNVFAFAAYEEACDKASVTFGDLDKSKLDAAKNAEKTAKEELIAFVKDLYLFSK